MTHTHVHMHAGRHFYKGAEPCGQREREKFNLPVTRSSPSQHVRGKLVSARESSSPCRNKTRRLAMLLCELIFKPHTHSLTHWQEELGGFFKIAARRVLLSGACVCAFFCLCAGWRLIFTSLAYQVPAPRQKGLVLKNCNGQGVRLIFSTLLGASDCCWIKFKISFCLI
jgi:hypothetical protein